MNTVKKNPYPWLAYLSPHGIGALRSALLMVALILPVRAAGPLVQNGGFETGSFPPWTQSGNTSWSVVSADSAFVHSGVYGARMGPTNTLGYLSQALPTAPGQIYLLSFWLRTYGDSPNNEFNASWNGSNLFDATNLPSADWSNYLFAVTATSYGTVVQFGFRNEPSYFAVDDVSVTPICVGIDFDDMADLSFVTNGYEGLNWNNFRALDGVHYSGNPSGCQAGVVSTNNVVYNPNGDPASITNAIPFNLFSAYLTAVWNDDLQVEVKGYAGANLLYDNTYTLSATNRTLINFDYLGVTKVDFSASGGTPHPGYAGSGPIFAMDNVNAATGPGVQSGTQTAPYLGRAAYVRSITEPWIVTNYVAAMDRVFGSNGWCSLHYETVNSADLFSPTMHFIYMEGSDLSANALNAFLNTNRLTLQSWVTNGGSLFLNAAPNQGGNINFGFGVTLNYDSNYLYSSGSAVSPDNPMFNGPFQPVGTYWTGNRFAHASITGSGLTPLITDPGSGANLLCEVYASLGHALFGGMTSDYFQAPAPQAANLRANIIAYANSASRGTFDDLPTSSGLPVPDGYHGLSWSNIYYIDGVHYADNPSGYGAAVISTNNVGYNAYGIPASVTNATPFNFISAYLTAAWRDNLQVEAQGYVGRVLAYDQTYTLSATAPTLVVFNYVGVTEVHFISSGGTPHAGYGYSSESFVMDDVRVQATMGPRLSISYTGANTAVVWWPSPSAGWRLQQTSTLLPGTWVTPAESVTDDGTRKSIVVSPPVNSRFYRLIYP